MKTSDSGNLPVQDFNSLMAEEIPLLPTPMAMADLERYVSLILTWNSKLNLCGFQDPGEIMVELVQDSFFLARFIDDLCSQRDLTDPQIADLGAGAGLPGIPLRAVWQKGRYAMIESRQKRALFLQTVLARLPLPNTSVFPGRAEDYLAANQPDLILSRAFMPWQEMLKFCQKYGGNFRDIIFMTNERPPEPGKGWLISSYLAYNTGRSDRWLWSAAPK